MASRYDITCDFCSIKICGSEDDWTVRANNWSVSVSSSWLESTEISEKHGGKQFMSEREISKDACESCAKKISTLIKGITPNP